VRLIQCVVWGEFPVVEMLQHAAAVLGFTLVLGFFLSPDRSETDCLTRDRLVTLNNFRMILRLA
jgi:hypothetical protein